VQHASRSRSKDQIGAVQRRLRDQPGSHPVSAREQSALHVLPRACRFNDSLRR
jgi:hypothetical protein